MAEPNSPAPKLVFLVMSAVAQAATIDQLATTLAPHTVLVHHDFSQTPDFALSAPNVVFVPQPKRTGWASFGFVDGVFHAMQYALANLDFDYLQLLSPSCLPIKPMREFEAHVSGPEESHFGSVDLLGDHDALMSVGYRAFTPEKTLRHRVTRRLAHHYFGPSPCQRAEAGIWLRSGPGRDVLSPLNDLAIKALSLPILGRHIFSKGLRPYYGSAWFGARRHVVAKLIEGFLRPGVRDYFSRLRIAEEFLIPTLLMQTGARKGPLNHLIQRFDEAHPGQFLEADLGQLKASPAFFARKFADDPSAPVRLRVLDELLGLHAGPPVFSVQPAQCVQKAPESQPGEEKFADLLSPLSFESNHMPVHMMKALP